MKPERQVRDDSNAGPGGKRMRAAADSGGRDDPAGSSRAQQGQTARSGQSGSGANLAQINADRPLFTLSVAADLLGLHPRTLRIYEEKGLVVPARTEGNRRRYSQNDIKRFQFIRRLTGGGVNLEGVRIVLDMADVLTRLGADANEIIERNLRVLDEESGLEGAAGYDE